ncbi:MAG TPA: TIGR03089 family protein [Jatrophihabitans sp.]|uniref:TIGR03089 family protein n=1 Tax=Jatrophihabitans sp. TaxID=1932789 RepID=UPI002DFE4FAF|nr:TIGR03089 family protein [Jatrophihabitans sp.]
MTPEQRFAELLAAGASLPFVTYYDEASGERSELSAKSLANWVAKTHHLLGDELGLGVGDTALVALPAHWISVPAILGCLTAGLHVVSEGDADVAFVAPATLDGTASIPDVFVIAPDSAAVGFRGAPPGDAQDYVAAVRPQADKWAGVQLRGTGADAGVAARSRAEVDAVALARAAEFGLTAGGRLLTTRDWSSSADWIDAVLAPLAVGGSVVIVRNASDDELIERRMQQERATARI